MKGSEIFRLTRGTKVIILITLTVSILAVLVAYFYYSGINRSEDPRTIEARKLLNEYDRISSNFDYHTKFRLLDSAMAIFKSLPDYESSFETGVILNNKCSSLLMMAIYDSSLTNQEKESWLELALDLCDSSITCYKKWKSEWGGLTENEISHNLQPLMNREDRAFDGVSFEKVFRRRTENILTAQLETDRRLSVSLTNRGTILRHMQQQDSALVCFREAIELWSENRIAKSNLNVLMGGEPVKPSLIKSLFPPDKNKR